MKIKKSISNIIIDVAIYVCLSITLVTFVYPILIVFVSSFAEEYSLIRKGFSLFPDKLSLDAYKYIFLTNNNIMDSFFVSVQVTFFGTLIGGFITCLLAYGLAINDLPFKRTITIVSLITMYFVASPISTYIVYKSYGITTNISVLVLVNLISPFCVIMMRNYFSSIPATLREVAQIDGANEFKVFYKIMLPLSKSMIATVVLMTLVVYWNDWMSALYYLTDKDIVPLQYLIQKSLIRVTELQPGSGGSLPSGVDIIPIQSLRMALIVVAMVPIIILYPFLQKYFISGYTAGAVKE